MWWHRFVNRTDAYAKQAIVGGHCQYFSEYQTVTPELFDAHLVGALTLGLPALDEYGNSRWCCFDQDEADDTLDRIAAVLSQCHWHYVKEGQRQGRAGHLWMFFDSPVLAADLRLFGLRILAAADVKNTDIEFFPKQDQSNWDEEKQRFRASSIVRLPLGINRKPEANGGRGWFEGVEQDINKQIVWIQSQPLNSASTFTKLVPELRQMAAAKKALKPIRHTDRPVDVAEVRRALTYLSPDRFNEFDTYGMWTRIGMALKTGGLEFSLWEEWSARSPKYKVGVCARKWATFSGDGKTTLGTIFHMAKKNGFQFSRDSQNDFALTKFLQI